ncbi:hypothetical protein PI124_g575 [Phytophthora idaei]|nr:hypothetical protein PI125_g12361 [Phytophthora idaei]KAG3147748.1 hypothetical protein PI126_g12748 [Phytophthora idaei]KAG3254904.1 hypothetical protein PI124_g575 [Phytophthora idaei]
MLYVMKRQKRKDAWHVARLVRKEELWEISPNDLTNDHANLAYCLLCDTNMKFRVGKSKVPQHVEAFHPNELAAFVAQTAHRDRGEGGPVIRNLDSAFASVDVPCKKRKLRVITDKEQKRANQLLAEWDVCHFRPMLIAEDDGFWTV